MPPLVPGLVGMAAVYVLLRRGIDRRAGAYGALVLATTPLWVLHARSPTAAIAAMCGGAVALAATFVAVLDPTAGLRTRVLACAMALGGSAVSIGGGAAALVVAPAEIGICVASAD